MDIVSRTSTFTTLLMTLLVINLPETESTIILQDNGYSGVLVAISEDEPEPSDNGTQFINTLQDLLRETSRALYQATNGRAYLKDIDILVPSKWDRTIQGQNPILTYTDSFHQADIRITVPKADSGVTLPYTFHSGKCGVAGSHIQIPSDFLSSDEVIEAKAKALVQQWAQFRYGVFEEHGYPGDILLPYFYRHPQGYDALTTSNDTIIFGNLTSMEDGMECSVDENGIISNQEECRFVPDETGQTATKSIMSFHWIDSIFGFSERGKHDGRAPHRQNRLCGSKSSWEIISQSPDWVDNEPTPGLDTTPNFVVKRNVMKPVILMVLDTSTPTSVNNTIALLRRAMQNFLSTLQPYNINTYVGLYTFEGPDINGVGNYLQELVAPDRLTHSHQTILNNAISSLTYSNYDTRNTPAVLRDGISLLARYKNVGGSIMYIVTSTASSGSDTLIEPKVAQRLTDNNIKVVIVESGPIDNSGGQSLNRLSTLAQGYYVYTLEWVSYQFFNKINNYILGLTLEILEMNQRMIISKEGLISTTDPWNGYFFIDETLRNDTSVVLVSPLVGLYRVTITDSDGVVTEFVNGDTNWFALNTTIGVVSKDFSNPSYGRWSYSIVYDSSNCNSCQDVETIQLLVISSPNDINAPKLRPWISLTAGTEIIDASQHPMIISARFDSSTYIPVGDLDVTAEIIRESVKVDCITLIDSGTLDADIAKDGIYGGIYYPRRDGEYTINILAAPQSGDKIVDRILESDQSSYCCGSLLPTSALENFQIFTENALSVQVINTASAKRKPPIVADLQAKTLAKQGDIVYAELTWTTPSNIVEQFVKYSYTEDELSSENIDSAPEADIHYGSLQADFGSFVDVYVSVPFLEGENIYLAVQTSSADGNTSSIIVWTELNPTDFHSSSSFPENSTSDASSTFTDFSETPTTPPSTSITTTSTTTSTTTTTTLTPPSTSITTTSTTTSTTTTTTLTPPKPCSCSQTDSYGYKWDTGNIIETTTIIQNCSLGVPTATGSASWICDYDNGNCKNGKFSTDQPDYSKCSSEELDEIINSVNDDEKNVTDIWISVTDFTSREDVSYYGHEIFNILDLITALLERQTKEMNGTVGKDELLLQIDSSNYGTDTTNNLISNDAQWAQLDNGDEGILKLLDVSNDIAFRLSNVSKLAGIPLHCEISSVNVTISSSYWDQIHDNFTFDCDLKEIESEVLLRFPSEKSGSKMGNITSYIFLPKEIKEKAYKAGGVFIAASKLVRQLLPGYNNSKGMDKKEVNSPLISFTIYDPEANGVEEVESLSFGNSYVELVLEHSTGVKDPPVQTIRRNLMDGEEPSAIMGSSICSYLFLNTTKILLENGSEVNINFWAWDDDGCQVNSINRTHTVCHCNHLTGFANLMSFHDYEDSKALDITSLVCSLVSITCLASTFFILSTFKSLKTSRKILTQNLCIALIISNLLILITLDKAPVLNKIPCAIMGMVLHYFLLVAFMWMLIEGYELHRMVNQIFGTLPSKLTIIYALLAYTVPLLIVVITMLTAVFIEEDFLDAYAGDETCWLVGDWKWAFNGPVAAVILANLFFLMIAVNASCNLQSSNRDSTVKKIRKKLIGVVYLTFFLGIAWVTGFLMFYESIVFAFVFTVSNGLQGVFIFIDRCILNAKIRTSQKNWFNRLHKSLISKWNRLVPKKTDSQNGLRNELKTTNKFDINNWNWVKSSANSLKLRGKPIPQNVRNFYEDSWWEEINLDYSQESPMAKNLFAACGIVDLDEGNSYASSGITEEISIFSVTTFDSHA